MLKERIRNAADWINVNAGMIAEKPERCEEITVTMKITPMQPITIEVHKSYIGCDVKTMQIEESET